jgi:ring-1,2-phenylacetyl-CoA epoxidase subunit PaaD
VVALAPAAAPAGDVPAVAEVWAWLAEIPDPEIPVLSIVDLGIVREVAWSDAGGRAECVVTITPTYSGCPATAVIGESIVRALRDHGIGRVRLQTRIAPAWTTDWLSDAAKAKLRDYGIAPPASQAIAVGAIGRGARVVADVACPRCGSRRTQCTSAFGSTPCKAMYRCLDCLEPFDHFKSH